MSILAGGFRRLWGAQSDRSPKVETARATTGGSLSQEPVVVWQAANPMEAQVVKGRLMSAGIPAIARGDSMGKICGFTLGSLAERDVLVPGPLAEKAQELLSEEVQWVSDEEINE